MICIRDSGNALLVKRATLAGHELLGLSRNIKWPRISNVLYILLSDIRLPVPFSKAEAIGARRVSVFLIHGIFVRNL